MKHYFLMRWLLLAAFGVMSWQISGQSEVAKQYFAEATSLQDVGQWEKAIDYYSVSLEKEPGFDRALFNRGLCYLELGKFQSANQDFGTLLISQPNDLEALELHGVSAFHLGNFEIAVNDFSTILGRVNKASAYLNRSRVYLKMGNIPAALTDVQHCIQTTAEPAQAFKTFGEILMANGDYADAEVKFRHTIALGLEDVEIYYNLGTVLFQNKKYKEATHCFNKCIQFQPSSQGYTQLALTQLELGKIDEAAELAEKAIEMDWNNPDAYFSRGICYFKKGDFKHAAELLDNAIESGKDHAEYYYYRAMAKYRMQLMEEAKQDCEKALSLKPDFEEAVALLNGIKQ